MKRKSRKYLIFLSFLSILILSLNVSIDELLCLKFLIPNNIFYFLITILLIYLENIYIVEEIRNMIELKENVIIRVKRKVYKEMMLSSLFNTLIVYFLLNIIWCFIMIGRIPLMLLILDLVIRIIVIFVVLKYYMKEHIYLILLLVVLFARFIESCFFNL